MSEAPRGRVLIIAGSDSGGGAGIQADIKAVSALGGFTMTAVTAITVQNTLGVTGIHPVPDDTVADQMRAVLSDLGADAIKTGMLATASLIETVASVLEQEARDVPLVLDPVMVATSGDALVDTTAAEAIKSRLLPRAALVTPNIPEAERLTGLTIGDLDTQIAAAEALVEAGAKAALVKGGHMSGQVLRDVLVSARGLQIFEHERLDTPHTHGTGCTLASAISSLLAQGHALPEAVRRAGDYLHNAIRHAPGFGAGHGPVDHFWMLRD